MPWEVRNQGSGSRPYCVFKKGTDEKAGCHTTRAKATAQVRALYAADSSLDEFNALVLAAHEYGDTLEEDLAAVYRKALRKRGKSAATKMRALGIQASASIPPSPAELYERFSAKEREELAAEQERVAEQVAEILLIPLGLGFLAATFLEVMTFRSIETFDDAAIREIQAVVQAGLNSGLTISEIASSLIVAFDGSSATTAEMLARTHITAITNESSLVAARGIAGEKPVYKQWATMRDPRVRLPHSRVEGQTRPLDAPFDVGGSYLMYPGDPSGPIALTANCRCVLTYTRALPLTASASTLPSVDDVTALETKLAELSSELGPVVLEAPDPFLEALTLEMTKPITDPRIEEALERLSLVTRRDRYESYKLGMELGLLSYNDCLVSEGLEPVDGGDVRRPAESSGAPIVIVGNNDEKVAAALTAITDRLASGEKVTEEMMASLRSIAELRAAPVEPPVIQVMAPEQPAPQIVFAPVIEPSPVVVQPPERRTVTFQRDQAGRLTSADIEDDDDGHADDEGGTQ